MAPDAASTARWLDEHGVRFVRTESVSVDGLLIGKHLSPAKFVKALPIGNAITEFVLGYDLAGTPYLAWWDPWRRDALGDFHPRPDLDPRVLLPPDDERAPTAAVLCDIADLDGNDLPGCPRTLLRNVVGQLDERGFEAQAAFELECMLFAESPDDARA